MNEPTPESVLGTFHARIMSESGNVTDSRRFVAFLYLLMRDHVPVGRVLEPCASGYVSKVFHIIHLQAAHCVAVGLVDEEAIERTRVYIACVLDASCLDRVSRDIASRIPAQDDVATTFSNGWLARIAQFVADEVSRP